MRSDKSIKSDTGGIALVTGGTAGIGEAFAEAFAAEGRDLVITGRRREKIEAVADRLRKRHGVNVEVILGDLADAGHLESLVKRVRKTQNLEVLVNNAGFGIGGGFTELGESDHLAMIAVHTAAVVRLTYAALPGMIARKKGVVINVSSIGANIPFPGNAMYGGTKAFVRYFTESLHLELIGTGVKVQALCPGMTRTDFHTKMGFKAEDFYQSGGLMKAMTPQEVVEISLKCLTKDDPICVPGLNNRFMLLMFSVLPRRLTYWMSLTQSRSEKTEGN
jgi:short-subunit dehydrogenase